jgi:hypothetical protein
MSQRIKYVVAKSFTKFPGGRRRKHGDHSGEEFRETVLLPLLDQNEFITFDLSGSAGYSSGFLDEAFGEIGAILGYQEARRRIEILASDDPEAVETCWRRITDAASERSSH